MSVGRARAVRRPRHWLPSVSTLPDLHSAGMGRFEAAVVVLLLAASGCVAHTTSAGTFPQTGTALPAKTVVNARGNYFPVIDNDGTYVVGIDIGVGKYRRLGGTMCHWARLNSLDSNDIIDAKSTGDQQVVTIRATDTAFFTQNCGTWQMIPAV